jgi:hypothetical protein
MKPTPTKIDLAPSFNGRVGDSQSFTKLWFKQNGLPLDLTKYSVYFAGKDANGTAFKLVDFAKADQTGDNLQIGKITFYIPGGTFQVEGDWDYTTTFFGITDADGTVISTVNVGIHVLANSVEFGIDSKPYYTELETLITEMKQYISDNETQINSTVSEITDKDSTLNKNIAALEALITNYQKLITDNAILSEKDITDIRATIANLKIQLNRTTAFTPQQYVDNSLGLTVTHITNSSVVGVAPNDTTYGYLTTDVVTPATEAATSGSVFQTYKIGVAGKATEYVRVNTNATTWGAWQQVTTW